MSKLSLECVGWKPLRRNTLAGFAQIRVIDMRLTVIDVALHNKGTQRWAAMPSKPVIDRDGIAKRDPSSGKIAYTPMFDFDSAAVRSAFSDAVIAAVLKVHPDVFTEPVTA
jgi:hypothetical protein